MIADFNLPSYTFYFNETESSHEGTSFSISDSLTFKQRPDHLYNEPGRLKSTSIKLNFPRK